METFEITGVGSPRNSLLVCRSSNGRCFWSGNGCVTQYSEITLELFESLKKFSNEKQTPPNYWSSY